MVHHRRYGYAPWGMELFSGWLGLDRQFFGGSEVALVVRLETDVIGTDPTAAELRLRQMEENVEEWVRPLGRSGKTRNTRGVGKGWGNAFPNFAIGAWGAIE